MKKPLPQKKQAKGSAPPRKKRWIAVGGLVVVLVLIGIIWVIVAKVQNDRAIQKEKQQFSQVEKDINEAANMIKAQFGKPSDDVTDRSCVRHDNEFIKGPISCSIDRSIVYSAKSRTYAQDLATHIGDLIKRQTAFLYIDTSNSFANREYDSASAPDNFLDETYKDKATHIDCRTGYYFFTGNNQPSGFPSFNVAVTSQNLLVEINCSDYTKATLYPIQ